MVTGPFAPYDHTGDMRRRVLGNFDRPRRIDGNGTAELRSIDTAVTQAFERFVRNCAVDDRCYRPLMHGHLCGVIEHLAP